MIKQRRLTRIESSLTPKQAVLFWLRQEHQGKTSSEWLQWMNQRPRSAAPRNRVELLVVEAIRTAMKGHEAAQISQAARQGQMYADFLILLVSQTNHMILDDRRCRWFQIALLREELRNAALSDDREKVASEWAVHLRGFAIELFSLQKASDLIRDTYFDGECILFKDAIEELERQTGAVHLMMDAYNGVVREGGQGQLAIDSHELEKDVNELASKGAGQIVAMARCKMLEDFGEGEAADAVLKSVYPPK